MRRTHAALALTALLAALAPPIGSVASTSGGDRLLAGVGVADITPENGREFFGYVRPDIRAEGVALRLTARALVLQSGKEKLALVTIDMGAPPQGAKDDLVARIADLGFTHENVLLAGTHTHAGPDVFFDGDAWISDQMARAVRAAHRSLSPARAAWATTRLANASDNRSVEAHLAGHGLDLIPGQGRPRQDPRGRDHTIDPTLRLLRVDRETDSGLRQLAAWGHFSAHATTFVPANTLYSADFPGVAVRRFEDALGRDAPVAIFTNGNEGDLSPRFAGYNQHAAADEMGRRVARAMGEAWRKAGRSLRPRVALDARWTRVCFCGQEVTPARRVSPVPIWGMSFFGGAEDGPSIFYEPLSTEGRRRPAALADPVHGRKIPVAPAPFETRPEVQALRIGDRMLLAVPGEPSVQMGRRLRVAAGRASPSGVRDAVVVSLAGVYTGYYTTPAEYEEQHYEGGHTVFGKWSGELLRQTYRDLAAAMAAGKPGPEPAAPPGEGDAGPGDAPVGGGDVLGRLLESPPPRVERMATLGLSWQGSENGRDRPVGQAFLVLQRGTGDGWRPVDSDLGYAFVWTEDEGAYRARYDVRPDLPPGRYRTQIVSDAYTLTTRPFRVVPSDGLIVRGVRGRRLQEGTKLTFVAQNPPPDPDRNLLSRRRGPKGGTLRFTFRGSQYAARWNPRAGGWTTVVPGDARHATVRVPARGLADRFGNTSGRARRLRVGQVTAVDWPPSIGPGGGRTPGPFGQGTFPP